LLLDAVQRRRTRVRAVGVQSKSGVVVVYLSPLGQPLRRAHQRFLLEADARTIADIKKYEFGGYHQSGYETQGPTFFVPDQTLLSEEAASLGIRGPKDLYGGVVSHCFAKTKSITHQLVDGNAARPEGWSQSFAERIHDFVLPGYTAFAIADAERAAERMFASQAPIRVKRPLCSGGRGQVLVTTLAQLDRFMTDLPSEEIETYGVVLETNLREICTLSIGRVELNEIPISYHGIQSRTKDNEGNWAYGGSDLFCVRGDWDALAAVPMPENIRMGMRQAQSYDQAMNAYPGFMASRRNYDIAQGIDAQGQWRSGVLESSWRAGGASPAELLAISNFLENPDLQELAVSHVETYGPLGEPPPGAVVHFQGEDPAAGPIIRYTLIRQVNRRPV
jgi:hypothetical protein